MASLQSGTLTLRKSEADAFRAAIKRNPTAMDSLAGGPLVLFLVALADIERGDRDSVTLKVAKEEPEAVQAGGLDGEACYRAVCEAAGWRYYDGTDHKAAAALREWVGEPSSIAHIATVEGRESFNDSVYATWEACCLEACASLAFFDQRRAVVEGWYITDCGNGRVAIVKDDEQAVFASDEDAERHVRRRACFGSAYHRHARAIVSDQED